MAPTPVRYTALLKGINVGGHTVKMDRLRALFSNLGFDDVSTIIASGNVRFAAAGTAPDLERRIEGHLAADLGFDVATFLRTDAQLARVAALEPFVAFASRDGDTRHVAFLKSPPSTSAKAAVLALGSPDDVLVVAGSELHWLRRGRFSDSAISGAKVEKALGGPATVRNLTTVRKLAALGP